MSNLPDLRVRFRLKSPIIATAILAVALTLIVRSGPAWIERHIQITYVKGRPAPSWWPDEWDSKYSAQGSKHFEYTYAFGSTPEESALLEVLGGFEERITPPGGLTLDEHSELMQLLNAESEEAPHPVPLAEWSEDNRSCRIVTTGAIHRGIYQDISLLRQQLNAPSPKARTSVGKN